MMERFLQSLEGESYRVFSLYSAVDAPVEEVDSGRLSVEVRRWASRFHGRLERVVVIFGRMTFSMIAAWFGAILAGKLPVFISHPSRKIASVDYAVKLDNYVQRFQSCLFVGEEQDRVVCEKLLTPLDEAHDFVPGLVAVRVMDGGEPLFLQCSSGTTGLQKAVAITADQLNAQIEAYAQALVLDPKQDRIVSWLPLYHDMGLVGVFLLAVLTRTPLYLLETFAWAASPGWLLEVIARCQGSLCWLPNFAFSLVARVGGVYDLSYVRSFINCSEPVSVGAFERFMTVFGVQSDRLSVCYALAENVFAATQTPLGRPLEVLMVDRLALNRRQVRVVGKRAIGEVDGGDFMPIFSCGKALSGVSIWIATRSLEEEVGEIWLRGPCVVPGYYGLPLSVNEEGWRPTGDLGFIWEGELYVTGRMKDLIIQNGKNIHPQDVEEVVNRHVEVYPGRVVAVGRPDELTDSEQVLVLFESVDFLDLTQREQVLHGLRRELDILFDISCEVDCVPRNWLRKTSSGKMARQENLGRYMRASQTAIHLVGDSHVRIFWTTSTSHHNRFLRIHAHWLGLLRSDNWREILPFFVKMVASMQKTDGLILQFGEPECRSVFPVDPDPMVRIQVAVASYREFLQVVRQIWPGRLAYMTGIPTHPCNIDNQDEQWPIRGTPEVRYRWQQVFYRSMELLCTDLMIHFIDVCTPLIGADGWMDVEVLCDKAHLDPGHIGILLERFENCFGYLDFSPNTLAPELEIWDGSYGHYQELMRQKIREINPIIEDTDWNQLVSGGLLDSLSIVEIVAMLDRTFHFNIVPNTLRRENFESIDLIWDCFGPSKS